MGTESYLNDDSMVYNPNTGTYSRAGDIRAGSGVLTQQEQDKAIVDEIIASIEAENATAANTGGPKTDFPGMNRDVTSDAIGGYAVDLGSVFSLFPDPVAGAVSAAMQNDYLNSILQTQLTPEQKEAQLLGLSEAQMNAKTEDMLDSILNSQGENETGFVNESARIAAEGILKGKILQAGVTDPVAQEAALKSAMESLEQGGSGLDAVKAAAAGAQDFVGGLLKTAKDAVDAGYDKIADILPDGAMPDTVGVDPTTGQTTVVYGKTSGTPVLGGTVGTRSGGTYAGVTTTGSAIVDKLIKVIKAGGSVESVIEATTGLPSEIVGPAVTGAKKAAEKVVAALPLVDEDDPSKVVLTTTGGETLDPNSTNPVLTVGGGDEDKEVGGNGVEIVTGNETLDPNSTNPVLTVGDTTKNDDDKVAGGGAWQNDGAGTPAEVISDRIIGDPFTFKPILDDDDDEVISDRIIGDPFTFKPILDKEQPPASDDEVPPVLDEVPPEPPPEVPDFGGQGFMGVQTKPGELVDLGPLYDISGSSIFQEPQESDEDALLRELGMYSPYAESGIVQDYDIEELIRFLANQRG